METDDDLVPPASELFDGSTTREEFRAVGEGFTRHYLIAHAQLKPHEKVLDVGSGSGQKARVLAGYLNAQGSYDGIDIVPKGIAWCAERYRRFPNFRFQLADVYSRHYHPEGRNAAARYRFPFDDASFDLVFLSSVFTHMLPKDMANYLREIARVLKPGGRSVITYFLLNPESRGRIAARCNSVKVPIRRGFDSHRIADRWAPEKTVAHDEAAVRRLYDRNGMSVVETTYGFWCGRRDLVRSLQDCIIAVRE